MNKHIRKNKFSYISKRPPFTSWIGFESYLFFVCCKGSLHLSGEDSVRGLHLDELDVVLVASRSVGPDEYTHAAGRTGTAGKSGGVVNVVSDVDVSKVTAWEKM